METFLFRFNAMGGENELQLVADHRLSAERIAERVIREVERIEAKFSRYRSDSVVSQINAAAGRMALHVDSEVAGLLEYADACYRQSSGLFDITSGVLRKVWNFRSDTLPERNTIQALLPLIGWKKVKWRNPWLYLPTEGMELDFGGIGKEYAVDRAAGVLTELGVQSWLVNLAGDVRVSGTNEHNLPWSIGVADPEHPGELWGTVELKSGAAATSGDYERRIEIDGKRYSHLLNPRTGWPTEGLQSVTAFADSCIIAGSVTTTAMLLGRDGLRYLDRIGVPYVAVTSEGRVVSASALAPDTHRRFERKLPEVNRGEQQRN